MGRRKTGELLLVPEILSEEQEQHDLIRKCDNVDERQTRPLLARVYHVPNGGWRAIKTALKMKLAGVRPGVPDLFLPVMRVSEEGQVYGGLYIEMKRDSKAARLSEHQTEWVRYLREAGYLVAVCKGCRTAWNLLCWYIDLPPYTFAGAANKG